MKKIGFGVLLLCCLTLSACQDAEAGKPLKQKEFNTGTYTEITLYGKDKEEAMKQSFADIQALEKKIEVNEQGESEIDKVNDEAGVKPVKVSSDVFDLVEASVKGAEKYDGLFNPAIGAVTSAWHIGFSDAVKPSNETIKELVKEVDYKKIELDKGKSTVFLKEKGMKLDFGGDGKGWIAQQVINDLKKKDIHSAIINLGGHVFTYGENPGNDSGEWRVNIGDPSKVESDQQQELPTIATMETKHTCYIMTSMYARYMLIGNELYTHLMDSNTGRPIKNDLTAVIILGDDPVEDDILSNALYGMGLKKGMDYVNSHKEIDAIFATNDNKLHVSKGLKEKVKLEKDSKFTVVEDN